MKKITGYIKLQIPAGKANPSPPVGPALGQHGLNIMEFCKAFNAKTQSEGDTLIPAVITVYADRSFSFITKTPPASTLLFKALSLDKGSSNPKQERVGCRCGNENHHGNSQKLWYYRRSIAQNSNGNKLIVLTGS